MKLYHLLPPRANHMYMYIHTDPPQLAAMLWTPTHRVCHAIVGFEGDVSSCFLQQVVRLHTKLVRNLRPTKKPTQLKTKHSKTKCCAMQTNTQQHIHNIRYLQAVLCWISTTGTQVCPTKAGRLPSTPRQGRSVLCSRHRATGSSCGHAIPNSLNSSSRWAVERVQEPETA